MDPSLTDIAEQIDTGRLDPQTTRALVVFNPTHHPQSGVARFRSEMSWPRGVPLSPVAVTDGAQALPASLTAHPVGPDRKGRGDRERLALDLRFPVEALPPRSWRTYWASYADASSPPFAPSEAVNEELLVVETLPHDGPLPAQGRLPIV